MEAGDLIIETESLDTKVLEQIISLLQEQEASYRYIQYKAQYGRDEDGTDME